MANILIPERPSDVPLTDLVFVDDVVHAGSQKKASKEVNLFCDKQLQGVERSGTIHARDPETSKQRRSTCKPLGPGSMRVL
jgi:hypothetical protein